MNKNKLILMVLIGIVLMVSIMVKSQVRFCIPERNAAMGEIPEPEKIALDFVAQKMSGPDFSIYTNYLDKESNRDTIATGKDILSESQGLILLYLLNRNQQVDFDSSLQWTMKNLILSNGIISWKMSKSGKKESTNALIDDLRLLRALILANEKWRDEAYLQSARKLSKTLLTYNTLESSLIDFYDERFQNKSNMITLSYIDLYTMKKMMPMDAEWKQVYDSSYEIINNGKIQGTGLYEYQYFQDQKSYSSKNENCLIQSVYTLLHLAEVGEYDREGLKWLWNEYEKHGKIYVSYSSETYEPVTDVESTALYALAARLFFLANEPQKSEKLLKESQRFQVLNEASDIYGSFGDEQDNTVYSFDNLQYLLSSSFIY